MPFLELAWKFHDGKPHVHLPDVFVGQIYEFPTGLRKHGEENKCHMDDWIAGSYEWMVLMMTLACLI